MYFFFMMNISTFSFYENLWKGNCLIRAKYPKVRVSNAFSSCCISWCSHFLVCLLRRFACITCFSPLHIGFSFCDFAWLACRRPWKTNQNYRNTPPVAASPAQCLRVFVIRFVTRSYHPSSVCVCVCVCAPLCVARQVVRSWFRRTSASFPRPVLVLCLCV